MRAEKLRRLAKRPPADEVVVTLHRAEGLAPHSDAAWFDDSTFGAVVAQLSVVELGSPRRTLLAPSARLRAAEGGALAPVWEQTRAFAVRAPRPEAVAAAVARKRVIAVGAVERGCAPVTRVVERPAEATAALELVLEEAPTPEGPAARPTRALGHLALPLAPLLRDGGSSDATRGWHKLYSGRAGAPPCGEVLLTIAWRVARPGAPGAPPGVLPSAAAQRPRPRPPRNPGASTVLRVDLNLGEVFTAPGRRLVACPSPARELDDADAAVAPLLFSSDGPSNRRARGVLCAHDENAHGATKGASDDSALVLAWAVRGAGDPPPSVAGNALVADSLLDWIVRSGVGCAAGLEYARLLAPRFRTAPRAWAAGDAALRRAGVTDAAHIAAMLATPPAEACHAPAVADAFAALEARATAIQGGARGRATRRRLAPDLAAHRAARAALLERWAPSEEAVRSVQRSLRAKWAWRELRRRLTERLTGEVVTLETRRDDAADDAAVRMQALARGRTARAATRRGAEAIAAGDPAVRAGRERKWARAKIKLQAGARAALFGRRASGDAGVGGGDAAGETERLRRARQTQAGLAFSRTTPTHSAAVAVQRRARGRLERRRAGGARAALDAKREARELSRAAVILAIIQAKVRGKRRRKAMRRVLVRASFAFDGAEDGDLRIARGERLSCLRADYEAARASRKVADLEDVAADGRWDEERDDLDDGGATWLRCERVTIAGEGTGETGIVPSTYVREIGVPPAWVEAMRTKNGLGTSDSSLLDDEDRDAPAQDSRRASAGPG